MDQIRKIIATIAFFGLIFVSLLVLSKPGFDSTSAAQSALAVLVVGLLIGRAAVWAKPSKIILVPVLIGLIAIPFVILSRAFGSYLVLSLVFHAQFGISGADFAGFEREIFDGVLYVTLIIFAAYALTNLLNARRWVYLSAALALIVINPLARYLYEYGAAQSIESDLHLSLETPQLNAPEVLPDIIIVYLEGIERGFADEQIFGDIYRPIETYEALGTTFTGVRQVNGTAWSLAGIVATHCGVPLVPNGFRYYSGLDRQVDFMPDRACLSDVLGGLGYETSFVMGGGQDFGGYDHFFKSHQFDNIVDSYALTAARPAAEISAASSGWVLDDQLVFDASRDLYDQKASNAAPMFLTIATYGPHGSTSILSRDCTDDGQAGLAPDIPTAISCTLDDTVGFLDHVIANSGDRPTIVMLASDHLNHDPAMGALFAKEARRNTVIMFGLGGAAPLEPGTQIEKAGSMLDLFPTLLAFAGVAETDATGGLGRSLLADASTIVEEKGLGRFNAELFPNPLLNRAIWGEPDE